MRGNDVPPAFAGSIFRAASRTGGLRPRLSYLTPAFASFLPVNVNVPVPVNGS